MWKLKYSCERQRVSLLFKMNFNSKKTIISVALAVLVLFIFSFFVRSPSTSTAVSPFAITSTNISTSTGTDSSVVPDPASISSSTVSTSTIFSVVDSATASASVAVASSVSASTINFADSTEWSLPDGTTIRLIIASTSAEQELGLGDRSSLPAAEGMLFVFDQSSDYGFWMKDMEFPLDIIWLDKDFKIIHIEPNLSPSTYPQAFSPGSPAKYVIEVNAGFAKQHTLAVGQTVQIK